MTKARKKTRKNGRTASLALAPCSGLVAIGEIGRFKPIKPGKIHLKCRRCKNTRSNMARADFDPINAVVMVMSYCPRCDRGGEFESVEYYDAVGREITED